LLQGKAGGLSEEQKKQLGMILNSGRHLLSLINDLLDFSKIESGTFGLTIEKFDVNEVIEDVLNLVKPIVENKNLSVNYRKSDSGIMTSDKKRVQQIILNIVNNAVKFTPKGSVEIGNYRHHQEMRIEIQDTGIGIKKTDQEKIFQPFVQIDNTLTKTYQGTGLGLAVSQKLIEMLGGSISVESKFGSGTKFILSIPDKD
jgi:signal transduction histidine kinase